MQSLFHCFSPRVLPVLPTASLFLPKIGIYSNSLCCLTFQDFRCTKGLKPLILCGFLSSRDFSENLFSSLKVGITTPTRNQVAFTGSWVRIPPLPPSKNPVTMRVSGFFFFCARSKKHPVFSCSFHNFGKNSFLLYSPLFSAFCSHLLPKSPASGRGMPLTIACAEESFEL